MPVKWFHFGWNNCWLLQECLWNWSGQIHAYSCVLKNKNEILRWDTVFSLIIETHWANITADLAWEKLYWFVSYCWVCIWNWHLLYGSSGLQRSCRTIPDLVILLYSHGQKLVKRSKWEKVFFCLFVFVCLFCFLFCFAQYFFTTENLGRIKCTAA